MKQNVLIFMIKLLLYFATGTMYLYCIIDMVYCQRVEPKKRKVLLLQLMLCVKYATSARWRRCKQSDGHIFFGESPFFDKRIKIFALH